MREKPSPTSGPPCPGNPTYLSDNFFTYLYEFHLEHNKGQREEEEGDEKPGGREGIN